MTASTQRLSHEGRAPKRRDQHMVSPFRVTLVTDENHPLYQRRARRPFVEEIVQGMLEHGVQEAIIIRQNGTDVNGPIWEVVDGRQRVINAREAWMRQKDQKVPDDKRIAIPVTIKDLSDQQAMEMAMMLNAHTQSETTLEKAEFIQKYLNMVGDTKESRTVIMMQYRMSADMIDHHLKVLTASPEVLAAVDKGEISVTAAAIIAKRVKREKQGEVLKSKVRTVKDARRAGKAVAEGKSITKGPKMMTESEVRRLREVIESDKTNRSGPLIAVLAAVLGEDVSSVAFVGDWVTKAKQKGQVVRVGKVVAPLAKTPLARSARKSSRKR